MPQFTKLAIENTFIELLGEKPLDKITITDIVTRCGVNRNTFYYYFQDIYDLLNVLFRQETDKILKNTDLVESWQESILSACRFALDNKRAMYHLYNSSDRERLNEYFSAVVGQQIERYIRAKASDLQVDEQDIKLIIDFYKCAGVGLALEWMRDNMEIAPDKYLARFYDLFHGSIRIALERASKNPTKA